MKWLVSLLFLCCVDIAYAGGQRIISLAPDITETLFAIGAGNQIVGVVKGSDYPAQAQQLPVIASYSGLDLERILALHPDLVVAWGNGFARQLAVLQRLHIRVYLTNPRQLQDIPATMRKLGDLTGHIAQANQQANVFEQHLARLKADYQMQKPVTVFYQLGGYSLMTINHDSWINQVITLCGGRNVFADAVTMAPEISWEAAVNANPDVVINDSAGEEAWKSHWQRWPRVTAVKHKHLYAMHPDWIDRAGPRLVDGAAEMCGYLQAARK